MPTVLLLDDERSFKDGRETLVARSTNEAIELTESLFELDELWLDYVLRGSDTTDQFLMHLQQRTRANRPLLLKKVYIHTSSNSAVGLLQAYLSRLNVHPQDIVRVNHDQYFIG
jgi:hypothetical protein